MSKPNAAGKDSRAFRLLEVAKTKATRNTLIYLVTTFLPKVSWILLLPIYTRLLDRADFGARGTLLSVAGFIGPVFLLGAAGAINRFYHDEPENRARFTRTYSSAILSVFGIGVGILLLLYGVGAWFWDGWFPDELPFLPEVALVLGGVFLGSAPAQVLLASRQARSDAPGYGRFAIAAFLVRNILLLAGAAFLVDDRVYGWAIGYFIAEAIVGTGALIAAWRDGSFRFRFHPAAAKAALAFGVPLVFHQVALWGLRLSDQLIIAGSRPLEELGLYSLAVSIASLVFMFINTIGLVWTPHYYRLMKDEEKRDSIVVAYSSCWTLGIGTIALGTSLFAHEILVFLSTPKFYEAEVFVGPLVIGSFLNGAYGFFVAPLFFYKKTRLIPILTVSAAAMQVALNVFFVPSFGAIAAAYATAGCYLVLVLAYVVPAHRLHAVPYPTLRQLSMIAALVAGCLFGAGLAEGLTPLVGFVARLGMIAGFAGLWLLLFGGEPLQRIAALARKT